MHIISVYTYNKENVYRGGFSYVLRTMWRT